MAFLKSYRGELILLAASLIWGTAFLFQSLANGVMGPLTFTTVRSFIATIVMGGVILIRAQFMPRKHIRLLGNSKGYRLAIYAGIATAVAMLLQQVGLLGTSSGKAGFLTSFYILFVPLLGFFINRKPSITVWVGLIAALIGFYFLSFLNQEDGMLNGYDLLIIGCAVAYAFQIFFIDQVKGQLDSLMFSFVQFGVATVITSIPMITIEGVDFSFLTNPTAIMAILYVGIMSSCVAYTLQIVGQKRAKSAPVATLIMSLEAVFALLAGMIFLRELVVANQWLGMGFIFLGILVVNMPWATIRFNFRK
jgi:drug/metabolite transporter (DMT)-like permease